MKYSKRLVNKICYLVSKEHMTIPELCRRVGISERIYYYWQKQKPEFCEKIQEAQFHYDQDNIAEAKRSLMKLIKGYFFTTVKTERIPRPDGRVIVITTHVTKYIRPSTKCIIWFLCTHDPENWSTKIFKNVSGKGGKDLIPAKILDQFKAEVIGLVPKNDENQSISSLKVTETGNNQVSTF